MPVLLNPRPRGIAQLFLAVGETGVLRWQCWRRPGGIQEGRLIWRSRGRDGGKPRVKLDRRKRSPLPPRCFLEVLILNGLQTHISEVLILLDLLAR
jgi:hypothetical protein